MLKRLAPGLSGILGAVLMTSVVAAQPGSPVCVRLEGQLAQIGAQGGQAQNARLEQQFAQQRAELDRTTAQARSMGCGSRFLFGPAPPPQCRGLEQRMTQLRSNLDAMNAQIRQNRSGGGAQSTAQRAGLIVALAQNGCGQQYVAAARQQQTQQQQQGGGLFGLLFGNRPQPQGLPEGPALIEPEQPRQREGYRTVCVRTCDGFFFPVNYSTSPSNFGRDADVCQRTCPGAEAKLFSYPTGGSISEAMSTHGEAYKDMPNAFLYQKEYKKDCSCKPANMTWSEALAGADDNSVRPGDIVVDEERSRQMSQPEGARSATPAEAARAAQDAASAAPEDAVEETAPETMPPSELNLEDAPGLSPLR